MDGKGKNKKKSRKSAMPHLAAFTGVLTDQHRNFTTLIGLSPNFPVVTGIKHHFTTFSECPLQEQFFCPGKWRIFRTKRTLGLTHPEKPAYSRMIRARSACFVHGDTENSKQPGFYVEQIYPFRQLLHHFIKQARRSGGNFSME